MLVSLTSELARAGSPVRAFTELVGTLVCETKRGSLLEAPAKRLLGFDTLTKALPVPPAPGANPGTVGTAFDYRLRFDLGPVACAETVASHAPLLLAQAGQRDLVRLIGSFFERTDALAGRLRAHEVEVGDDDDLVLTRACVALALLESVPRADYWAHLLPTPADLDDLVPDAVVSDVRALHRSAKSAFASFIGPIRAGTARYVANPTFAGSLAVGGADADLVVDDTLLELKTTKTLDGATLRSALLQLLGYALLDYDDHLGIRQVGVYFARQEYVRVWPLWQLIFPPADVIAWAAAGAEPSASDPAERLVRLRAVMQGVLEGSVVDFSGALES